MAEGKKTKAQQQEAIRPQNISVGEMLSSARMAKNLTVEAVSAAINIRSVQLRAIEENNIEGLPGMTYAVGFVRSYANYLGLNGVEVVHKFKAEHSQESSASKLIFPEPIAESRIPSPVTIGIGVLLSVAVLVIWMVYSGHHKNYDKIADAIPTAPVEEAAAKMDVIPLVPPPAAIATPATAPVSQSLGAVPVADDTPAEENKMTATAAPVMTVPVPPVVQEKPAVQKEPEIEKPEKKEVAEPAHEQPKEPVINIKHEKTHIVLKARQSSWIQITSGNGDVVYRKVLRPGETYSVPDMTGLSLVTSNAGGFDVEVDGQKVAPIGKPGEIIRGVVLDPSQLKKRRTK